MLINFNHLKTFYNALVHKMKNFRGNWEQNDPTADDYIKNRTHYSEGIKEVTVLQYEVDTDAGSATPMDSAGPEIYSVFFDSTGLQPFVVGQQYSVKWNNLSGPCTAKLANGLPVLGDIGLIDGYEDTGEPFLIAMDPREGFGIILTTKAGKYPITVTTRQEVVHKLDKKFIDIPDNLVASDELADVARSGSYYDLIDTPTVYTDVVRYNANQSLTENAKSVARSNIGAASSDSTYYTVKYTSQTLTDAQKQTARDNIGAASASNAHVDVVRYAVKQQLSDYQKQTARNNIGAGTGRYEDLTGVPANSIHYVSLELPSESIISIASNGEYSVAINSEGKIWRTSDGISWMRLTTLTRHQDDRIANTYWNKVTYCGGKFIALHGGYSLAYSDNGLNWTTVLIGNSGQGWIYGWKNITYSNGRFVVVSHKNGIAYSDDAVTWTSVPLTLPRIYDDAYIYYHNNKFVALFTSSYYKAVIASSADGIAWEVTESTEKISATNRVCYGNGIFIACGANVWSTSADGITWGLWNTYGVDNGVLPSNAAGLVFYNDAFYLVCRSPSADAECWLLKSTDGTHWTKIKLDSPVLRLDLFNGGLIAYDSYTGNSLNCLISADGETWCNKLLQLQDGTISTAEVAETIKPYITVTEENIPSTIARVGNSYTKQESDALVNEKLDSVIAEAKIYTDNIVTQKSQVQIITWGADD